MSVFSQFYSTNIAFCQKHIWDKSVQNTTEIQQFCGSISVKCITFKFPFWPDPMEESVTNILHI